MERNDNEREDERSAECRVGTAAVGRPRVGNRERWLSKGGRRAAGDARAASAGCFVPSDLIIWWAAARAASGHAAAAPPSSVMNSRRFNLTNGISCPFSRERTCQDIELAGISQRA